MRTIWVMGVSAILATAAFCTTAANAGGKKLNFGGPLGTFEATPHAKGSNSTRNSHSKKRSSKAAAQRRAAAKKAAARRRAAQRAAARKKAEAHAAARKRAAARHATEKQAGSKRAATTAKAPVTSTAATTPADQDEIKSAPVKASAIAGTNTLKFRPEPVPEDQKAGTTDTAAAKTERYECKKYIPSAGMTVSVPCPRDP